MGKRVFQILDDMNVHDIKNKTRFVSVNPSVTEVRRSKNGLLVTVGVPFEALDIYKQLNGKQRVFLMVIDGDEYDKRFKE